MVNFEEKQKKMQDGTLHETLKYQEKKNQEKVSESPHPNNGEIGPLAGIIIVLLVLVGGAFYFFNQQIEQNNSETDAQSILEEEDIITEKLKEQSGSDKIDAIEEDLKNTSIENLDKGINNIKKELGL